MAGGLVPSTYLTSWETTVGEPATYGTAWVQWASRVTPSTKKASTELMTTRVWRACRDAGRRKALTPLEMASRPVSDEPPLANERRMMMNEAP